MNLNLMTVSELRKLAAQFGIAGRSTMKKVELIAALSDPDIADFVALSVTVDKIDDVESIEDTMQAITNAEADAECERARRLAEYEAEAAYIEEGIEIDEATAAEHAPGEQVVISKYGANEAIATAAFEGRSIGGHVTRERGRWVLRAEGRTIRAKTLGKVAKLWAKALGFYATVIDVETMG